MSDKITTFRKYYDEKWQLNWTIGEIANGWAKLHVTEALKAAAEKVKLTDFGEEFLQEGAWEAIDQESILSSYPLNLIV